MAISTAEITRTGDLEVTTAPHGISNRPTLVNVPHSVSPSASTRSAPPQSAPTWSTAHADAASPRTIMTPSYRFAPSYAGPVLRAAVGHSAEVDSADAVDEVVARCRDRLGEVRPDAALLF